MSAARPIPTATIYPMPPKSAQPLLLTWRRAVITADAGLKSTTRHVLLTLSVFMDRDGFCYPNTVELSRATGLSERSVCTHLALADEAGWIERAQRGTGKDWKSTNYTATIPPEPAEGEPGEAVVATEPPSVARGDATEPHADATEPDDTVVLNLLQSNSPKNSTSNSDEDEGAGARGERARGERAWHLLPEDALAYRPQIAAFLDADDAERRRTAHAALRTGNTPPAALYRELADARERAGPLVQAAALVVTANVAESKSHVARLNFFRTVLQNLEAHAQQQRIGTDPAGPPTDRPNGNRSGRPVKSKDLDPAEALAAIRQAARATRSE